MCCMDEIYFILKLSRSKFIEVLEERRCKKFRVKCSNTIHSMRTNNTLWRSKKCKSISLRKEKSICIYKVRHSNGFMWSFFYKRQSRKLQPITWEFTWNLLHENVIYLKYKKKSINKLENARNLIVDADCVNDFKMSRKKILQQLCAPFL